MAKKKQKQPDIQDLVVAELEKHRGQLSRLSRLSKISYRYILAVVRGDIKDPGFRRLCHLASFLGIRVTHESCAHFAKFEQR